MLRFAGGWLCLTENQALDQDLGYLAAAHYGFYDVMETIFGSSEDNEEKRVYKSASRTSKDARGRPIVLSPNIFDVQFGGEKPPSKLRRKH